MGYAVVRTGPEPGAGDRILVLREERLELILRTSKGLEIRSARLREGEIWLGCRFTILALHASALLSRFPRSANEPHCGTLLLTPRRCTRLRLVYHYELPRACEIGSLMCIPAGRLGS